MWKRLALALSCGWPAWEEGGSGREESRSDGPAVQPDGPGKKKQIWLAVACVAPCRPPPLLTARPPGTAEMSGRRRLQLREACPISQPGWGRADPRGMQASPCDGLGPTKPKCSCCLQSLFWPGSGVLKDPKEINSHPARACGEPSVLSSTSKPLANPVGFSFKIQLATVHCSPLPPPSPCPSCHLSHATASCPPPCPCLKSILNTAA